MVTLGACSLNLRVFPPGGLQTEARALKEGDTGLWAREEGCCGEGAVLRAEAAEQLRL